jgi:MFS family permease
MSVALGCQSNENGDMREEHDSILGTEPTQAAAKRDTKLFTIIASASVGTLIEFYDLILAVILAPVLAQNLFPPGEARFLETLAIVVTSYLIRPIGALIFGRVGDSIGRKKPFLVSLLLMGGATFLIGCIPPFESIGWFAPFCLLALRLLQGLAISGEYTAATIFTAEHAPDHRRGYYTGFIQSTIPLSLLTCLSVLFVVQRSMSPALFVSHGWRLPFLLSAVLVILGYFIRKKLTETPRYKKLKTDGNISTKPVKESFVAKGNFKLMLLIVFGGCAAQATLMQTTHFVMIFFLQRTVLLSLNTTLLIVAVSTLLGFPFFQLFAALSDRVGRKPIMLGGLILSVILVPLVFFAMLHLGNPNHASTVHSIDSITTVKLVLLVASLHICCAMVYGPLGAFILEAFPTRIRFTSMGFVYNVGNGVLGGSTTFISELLRNMAILTAGFSFLTGLLYPIFLIALAIVINTFFIPETYQRKL